MIDTVTAYVSPALSLYHTAKVLSGLSALSARGEIRLALAQARSCYQAQGAGLLLEVQRERGMVRLGIDLHDRHDVLADALLEASDIYLKRSFRRSYIETLGESVRKKVRPFGLNYGCLGRGVGRRLFRAVGMSMALRAGKSVLLRREDAREQVNSLRVFYVLPRPAEFESPPEASARPMIVFQTRVWEAHDVAPDSHEEVNAARVELVRKLRARFGDRFIGGLVPTPYAQRRYPDALTPFGTRRREYVALSRSATIGIYTRGLNDSIAFKLPEYLASSKVVVADGFKNELPIPLVEGQHYLGFTEADECIEKCERALSDATMAAQMRRDNFRYYQQYVEPSAHARRCLEAAG